MSPRCHSKLGAIALLAALSGCANFGYYLQSVQGQLDILRRARPIDEVIGLPSYFSLGFLRPGPETLFGLSPRAFGAPGAGGSFAFADPDARLGYAYVMNKMDFYLTDDPREKALREAVYRAIAKLTARSDSDNGGTGSSPTWPPAAAAPSQSSAATP